MPYIKEDNRSALDLGIGTMVEHIKSNIDKAWQTQISDEDFCHMLGDINYSISRIIAQLMGGEISYSKIAMITGVLENVKQEFYRRAAAPYEDIKIVKNGDIKEFKLLNLR